MNVLFIGGTGIISSACAALAVERGIDLYLLTRGQSSRPIPEGAAAILGDISDPDGVRAALGGRSFDVVVDWIAFTPDQVERDIALFAGRTGQYVFISSASVYQSPLRNLPITESTPLVNPFWEYSRNKIACEQRLMQACHRDGFPATIVRPSHTYDCRLLPVHGGYTVIDRMRKGRKVVVHGDGTSWWVLTHHRDFAKGFVPLLGNYRAVGEAFHITSDERLTWDQIHEILGAAAGATPDMVHLPSDLIARHHPDWGAGLLGDKAASVEFDNSKLRRFVPDFRATIPFSEGAREIMAWYDADPARQQVDEAMNARFDGLIEAWARAWPAR
jgi:nucleoside-diphosphate-sugar epimerase